MADHNPDSIIIRPGDLYTCKCGAPLMTYQEVWFGTCDTCLTSNTITLDEMEEQQ